MMAQENSAMFKIQEEYADYARKISASLSAPLVRKRGLIEILGIACAAGFFVRSGFKVSTLNGLHKISEIFEDFKITDFYINNRRLDAITLFRDTKVRVPKAHLTYDCAADYYVIVQLSAKIKDAKVIGYIEPNCLAQSRVDGDYIIVDVSNVKPMWELEKILKTPAFPKQLCGKHYDCISLFMRFIDKELSSDFKKLLIQHLATCPACTKKLAEVLKFNRSMCEIPDITDAIKTYSTKAQIQEIQPVEDIQIEDFVESEKEQHLTSIQRILPDEEVDDFANEQDVDEYYEQNKFKSVIDTIYARVSKIDAAKINEFVSTNKKRVAIVCACVLAFFIFATVVAFHSSGDISSIEDYEAQNYEVYGDVQEEFSESHGVPKDLYLGGVDYSLVGEAAGGPVLATINKVSWEVPENLANKPNYKRYLQLVGKNIKLNLQNDLLLSNDFAKNNEIKLNIRIASGGDVIGISVMKSSGSDAIDEIIKKSVSQTLSLMKPPAHGLIARPADATLIINL